MAANARQIFNVISGNKIFSALGKKRRGNTFLGEVYWLSATEQTPTKRDAPKFECFLAGKGKHCFRNADEVYLWILNDSNPAPFVGVGHQSCSLRRNILIQTFVELAPWTAARSSSHTWLGIKNPWKNTKRFLNHRHLITYRVIICNCHFLYLFDGN